MEYSKCLLCKMIYANIKLYMHIYTLIHTHVCIYMMMMMSSVQPFSALGDPMNKGSPLMSTLHQLSQFFQSVSCFCKDAIHPSHHLSASPPSTTNLPPALYPSPFHSSSSRVQSKTFSVSISSYQDLAYYTGSPMSGLTC